MPFNFADGEFRQVLVYLGNNASFHVGMERVSQFSERSWWRHHDEGLRLAGPDHFFHGRGDLSRKVMLFDIMPIGWFDSASAAWQCGLAHASWPVAALIVSRRICVLKNLLDPEIWRYRVAIISQEQGLSTVADKHQGIMRNLQHVHALLKIALHRGTSRDLARHTPNG